MSVVSPQRQKVIQLYKQVLKLGKTWKAQDPTKTSAEREHILSEAREKFRANKNINDNVEIGKLVVKCEQRIVQAEHYGIPFERHEYVAPQTAYKVKPTKGTYDQLNLRKRK
ncbi:unnamed protein product [Auanema sp. JU1783]|nr:unnamed protein product [Auanema sp. JU1783]